MWVLGTSQRDRNLPRKEQLLAEGGFRVEIELGGCRHALLLKIFTRCPLHHTHLWYSVRRLSGV